MAAAAHLAAGSDESRVALATKPVPAACLGLVLLRAGTGRLARGIAAGLLLSAVADLAIEASFLAGLVLFLLVHVLYAWALWADTPLRATRLAPFVAWMAAVAAPLWSAFGPLRPAVVAYMAAIAAMLWRAAARVDRPGAGAAHAGLAGALLFGLSDTLIAIDRFGGGVPAARELVMLTYWAGQAGLAGAAWAQRGRGRSFQVATP